jgi:L-lactate dehydrogenase complex protein LldG
MEESTSKEKVLKYVREALISRTDQPFPQVEYEKPVFREMEEPLDINFAQELTAVGGLFVYCENEEEVINGIRFLMNDRKWDSIFALEPAIINLLHQAGIKCTYDHIQLKDARVGMTGCEALVARLGSVMVSTGQMAGRQIFVFPEVHVVLARTSQLVPDLKDALVKLRKKYEPKMPSMVTLITGPSRTADIEKTLVVGVHGPKELYVFLLEDQS